MKAGTFIKNGVYKYSGNKKENPMIEDKNTLLKEKYLEKDLSGINGLNDITCSQR